MGENEKQIREKSRDSNKADMLSRREELLCEVSEDTDQALMIIDNLIVEINAQSEQRERVIDLDAQAQKKKLKAVTKLEIKKLNKVRRELQRGIKNRENQLGLLFKSMDTYLMQREKLGEISTGVKVNTATPDDTKILQAFSYTVFDTILFSITQGAAPDFTLLSQSALFETVYINIARGYDSYLFNDIPASAPGVIIAGRALLESLRDNEDRYLDEEDLWDTYASIIQTWWINTALPILFGERDSDWDNVAFPAYEEMQHWKSGEFSQRQHFPAISDLVEIAKDNAIAVSEQFNFKSLLNA